MTARARPKSWLACALAISAWAASARADLVFAGDLAPPNPYQWISTTNAVVGSVATGSLIINNQTLWSASGDLGQAHGAVGSVTVLGATWNYGSTLRVGDSGSGTVLVSGGGSLVSAGWGGDFIGYGSDARGQVTLDGGTWQPGYYIYAGYSGRGTLTLTHGGKITGGSGILGNAPGATGLVTVDGVGSSWTVSSMSVGVAGAGTLSITNGGAVVSSGATLVGSGANATGVIEFGSNGGTLTTQSLDASPAQIHGNGTLYCQGLLTDANVTLDASHGLNQTLSWNSPGQSVSVHLDLSGSSDKVGDLGAGYMGAGTLTIRDGQTVSSATGTLGYKAGSVGTATVSGPGSAWTIGSTSILNVGLSGTGVLNVLDGAKLTGSNQSAIGTNAGSSGIVTVDGAGSTWSTVNGVAVGGSGAGVLNVAHGGNVTATSLLVGPNGTVNFGPGGGTLTTRLFTGASTRLTGSGTLVTSGLVSDFDLTFDATHGLVQQLQWTGTGRDVTVDLDLSGATVAPATLGIGYDDRGSLLLRDGATVSTADAVLGVNAGSTGIATIDGTGSAWTSGLTLRVGDYGNGSLTVEHGGTMRCPTVKASAPVPVVNTIGNGAGASGSVTIDGAGSNWIMGGDLRVGVAGIAALNILNGGLVTCTSNGYIGPLGCAVLDGSGSLWNIGGTLTLQPGSAIRFPTPGATIRATAFLGSPLQVSGNGTIVVRSIITDDSLQIDSVTGLRQTQHWAGANQDVDFVIDLTGASGATGDLGAGYAGSGTLTIQDGMKVSSANGYLGRQKGATGVAIVSGTGSTWYTSTLISNGLYVGYDGTGDLRVFSGGKVTNESMEFGVHAGASGKGTVDGPGSTLSSTLNFYVGESGYGELNVTRSGKVSSFMYNNIGYGAGSTGVMTIDGAGSIWSATTDVSIGRSGRGTLNISGGGSSTCESAHLGYDADAAGSANIDGANSSWTIGAFSLYVGYSGKGMVNITHGGLVRSTYSTYVGFNPGSTGVVNIDGPGSTFRADSFVYVGSTTAATGVMNITNGGQLLETNLTGIYIATGSLLTMTVGDGSRISAPTTGIFNSGTIRLKAAPQSEPGDFVPIESDFFGDVQAVGGTWDRARRTFTIAPAAAGFAGDLVAIDLADTQRIAITDPTTRRTVQASFCASDPGTMVEFTASPISNDQAPTLESALAQGNGILAAWDFANWGYAPDNQIFLSLEVGSGYSASMLSLWRNDGTSWSPFTPPDLSYDGTFASFSVTNLSSVAVTAVPEPPAALLLGIGVVVLLRSRHIRKDRVPGK